PSDSPLPDPPPARPSRGEGDMRRIGQAYTNGPLAWLKKPTFAQPIGSRLRYDTFPLCLLRPIAITSATHELMNILAELESRGLIADRTDGLEQRLGMEKQMIGPDKVTL